MGIPESKWETVERPGWFGTARPLIVKGYDEKYGKGNWRIRHILGPFFLDFNQAVRLYELSYELDFFNPDRRYLWNDLIKKGKDVWTELFSDIDSGTDYNKQIAPAHHYEDIAIRRIFQRNNINFKGDKLIRIRADSEDLIGRALSSIHIPFIYQEYIEAPIDNNFPWWNRHKGSLETFWHHNKVLQVKK